MALSETPGRKEANFRFNQLVLTFALVGSLLIIGSVLLPGEGFLGYVREFLKELGIVVLSVFIVSFLYERLVAEKYLEQFLRLLHDQFQQGESNAAVCARLGISEIFPTRDVFELGHPFRQWTSALATESSLRIVGRSLFHVMTRVETIKEAIERGARVELCIQNPNLDGPTDLAQRISDLEVSDIQSALSVFKKEIGAWVTQAKPPGSVELRYHQVPLLDSYLALGSPTLCLAVWDLSFGRSTTAKTIFLLDPQKPLGKHLKARYDRVWEEFEASTVFKYAAGAVQFDKLPNR